MTKGPWSIRYDYNVEGPLRRLVASTAGHQSNVDGDNIDKENKENAQAIASLPDLIEEARRSINSLIVMTALTKLKYGNLDKDLWEEIVKAEKRIKDLTAILQKAGVQS